MSTPEKREQRAIKSSAATLGFHTYDLSQPRASKQTPGLPDLYLVHPGRRLTIWWEVKAPGKGLTPAQERFLELVKGAGGAAGWGAHDAFLEALREDYGFPLE